MVMYVPRGGECLYICMYVSGRVVRLSSLCSREVTCAYTLTAPHDVILTWRDSKRIGDAWIDFYKVRVLPGSDNEQQIHLITELYDWSDNGNTRAEGLLLCICRKMDCSLVVQDINHYLSSLLLPSPYLNITKLLNCTDSIHHPLALLKLIHYCCGETGHSDIIETDLSNKIWTHHITWCK